ncbi:efflux transporter periplasmic adaptor subunit [Azoarcus sp. DD4]|uniref:efflux RND transporter periplasmic adaptor subunit n=1 Tax=Azoarcus sp. DD4 TaxID=2027405 RepID=UPI00112B752C|nr:efflux RND transporter periplasmic adaptor subunit [Azoarcus sp. DD4]QDF96994.1 efflux transporter periplasmic adaptor subunit [Azoarcus sp. DD4]
MTSGKQKKQWIAIAAVVAVGIALGTAIVRSEPAKPAGDAHGHGAHQEAAGHDDAEHHGGDGHEAHEDAAGHEDGEHHEDEGGGPVKGPHGGKLFTDGGYGLEVTIFEQGVEPQFRLYTYRDGKPLEPAQSTVELTLGRLGRAPQAFRFAPEGDYLKGDAVVSEPHSFEVAVSATHAGKTYRFGYEQVEARVSLSDAQLREAGVELATAGPARIATTVQLFGEVRYNGDRTVKVVPRLAGRVESVAASAGERVKKGQLLAVLSSHELADQRGEFLAAEQRLALARSAFAREKTLWEEKISAEQDFLQARAALQEAEIAVRGARQKLAALGGAAGAGGDLTRYELRAPIDGVVTDKRISVGEALADDTPVFTVSDLASVWIEATIAAQDLGAIAAGQRATVRANAFPATADGRIDYVSVLVGEQTRAATARIVLPNPDGRWRPGLPVTVEAVAEETEVPVAVAIEAVQTVRDWQVVFGRYGDALEARPLELGRSDGRFVEVQAGLAAGERYAATNSFLIKADLGKAGASHDH